MVAVKFTCKIVINICITAKPLERVICVYRQTQTASAGDTTGEAYTHENNKLKARLRKAILSRDKSCDRSCCRPKNFENMHACSQIRDFSKVSGFSGFNLVFNYIAFYNSPNKFAAVPCDFNLS